MGFFWLRFHAAFYNSLKINVPINRAWPRPASPSRPPVPVTPDCRACWFRQPRPTGPHVYLTATKIWYRLKRFSGTKCHNIHVLYHLKRFLGTVCYEHGAWWRVTPGGFWWYPCRRWTRRVLTRPGGGGASGGSLRSSRQAVACHPFTRSWATMPPEAPPPGLLLSRGFSGWSFSRYTAGESGFGEKITPYFFTIIVFESHSFAKNTTITWNADNLIKLKFYG